MDYSLIYSVSIDMSYPPQAVPEEEDYRLFRDFQDMNGFRVCLGIVDYLQDYNMLKYFETKIKALQINQREISCVPPEEYQERF